MEMEEAIKKVFEDLNKLSPEELEAELEKHSEGDIAVAMRELSEFIENKKEAEQRLGCMIIIDPKSYKKGQQS